MHRIPWVFVLVLLLATSSASAAVGTYINDPTTITEPGLYIVKRNLAVTSGSVITIAAGNVTLDLSGHLLSSSDINGALILIEGNQIVGSGGCGILFGSAGNNAYRGNMFGDNNGGAVCGPANLNAGGNIP